MLLTTKRWMANFIASLSMLNRHLSFFPAFLDPILITIALIAGFVSLNMNRSNSKL